jgi:hypothetical protein
VAVTEYEGEPVPGLPGHLPPGERILWQGRPDWKRMARAAFHVPLVVGYFAVLTGVAVVSGGMTGIALTLLAGLAGTGILALLAWAMARSTIYTLTNERLVFRFGVAVPMCVNIPLKKVATVRLNERADGSGDIALALLGPERAGYFLLWPHVRPWRLGQPEPMLRALADVRAPAALLSRAMAEAVPEGRRLAVPEAAGARPAFGGVPA